MSEKTIDNLTYRELQKKAKSLGVKATGKTEDLRQRVKEASTEDDLDSTKEDDSDSTKTDEAKLMYGGDFPKKVVKVEDVVIQGREVKQVALVDGSTTVCTPEEFKKRITKIT